MGGTGVGGDSLEGKTVRLRLLSMPFKGVVGASMIGAGGGVGSFKGLGGQTVTVFHSLEDFSTIGTHSMSYLTLVEVLAISLGLISRSERLRLVPFS